MGNSLALRIPGAIAAVLKPHEEAEISLVTDDGRLIVAPKHAREFALKELISGCKPKYFRRTREDKAWLQDSARGKELL